MSAEPATSSSSLTIQKAPASRASSTRASPMRISAVRRSGRRNSRRSASGIARGLTAIPAAFRDELLHVVLEPAELVLDGRRLRPGKPACLQCEVVAVGAVELGREAFERGPHLVGAAGGCGGAHVLEGPLEVGPPPRPPRRDPALDEGDRYEREDQDEGAEHEQPRQAESGDGQ